MSIISPNIAALTPSLTLAVTNRAKEMKAAGEQVYGLAGGEPEMDTPENIKQAAIKALENGATKYTPSAGILPLRQAICDKLKRDNNLSYTPDQIVVSSGAKQACATAIMATISEDDEVIIPAPYWVSYPEMVRIVGGTPVIVETKAENGWKLTPEEFADAMTPRTKMVILTTPNNPTGAVYTREELLALGEVALEEDILILADEIYEHLVYEDTVHTSIASLSEDLYNLTITINGFSKGYAMTGWRLGYSAAPAPIAKAIRMIQDHTCSNVCTFAQYGGVEALTGDQTFIADMREEYNMRRQYVYSRLKAIPNISVVEPKGAFYFFIDTSKLGLKSQNLCDKLLERYKVAAIPGVAFGNDNSIRISYCTTLDILKEGLDRFEEFCKAH
ncbi:pyridoxal phosphate-dependent aminotransferase [Akkermansia glycaniphila]|uniref:pyridoxal phosphate-dependent aminotransferase n=1 Tax=Akkermansia glycaniphila TaxID=1679444 RepID=UPI001C00D86F|nr:pyridoxal phosphate-dependent aminotransferase [Akkermansia glycaniphila]MBT9449860.1 pyridoxal phosphate-dependent aminotransferase [Akkermansia glycaniphila]